MKQLKKTLLTLVALLAVTTGAWADTWNSGACTVTLSDDVMTVSGTGAMEDYLDTNFTPWYGNSPEIKTIVIESGVTGIGNFAFASLSNLESVSIPASVTSIGTGAFRNSGSDASALTVSFAEGSTPLTIGEIAFSFANLKSIDIPNRVTSIGNYAFQYCSHLESVSIPASVTSIGEGAFSNCGMLAKVSIYAPSLTTYGDYAFDDNASGRKISVPADAVDTYKAGWPNYAADIVGDLQPLATGPEVAWNKAENSGSFTMPGGNVTLQPEYYPQAALTAAPTAINDVPATTDGAIVNAGTVANIGETTNAQGTVMYYVSPTALDDAALQALAADQWTADVPTAADLAQGQAYVYYYVRGNDSDNDDEIFSDGDILSANALTVTIAAAPTYAVTFAEGTDPNEWTASPNTGVTKGQTVTVTYTGTKKVIGVKAEKKAVPAAAEGHALSASAVGEIVGSDGNVYAVADKDNLPSGVTAVAMIAYVGTASDCAHGLAIALADESGTKEYEAAGTACSGKAAVTGGTWRLPSIKDWQYMFIGCGASDSYSDDPSEMSYSGLASKLTTAQGDALQNDAYWTSTPIDVFVWNLGFDGSSAYFSNSPKDTEYRVRACLAF